MTNRLNDYDEKTLMEWGQALDKIKDFLPGKMDEADIHTLLELIDDYAIKNRKRAMVIASLNLIGAFEGLE